MDDLPKPGGLTNHSDAVNPVSISQWVPREAPSDNQTLTVSYVVHDTATEGMWTSNRGKAPRKNPAAPSAAWICRTCETHEAGDLRRRELSGRGNITGAAACCCVLRTAVTVGK